MSNNPTTVILEAVCRWRNRILGWFVTAIVTVMVVTVLWQVFTRKVLGAPAVWTEEASTYMLMWCGLIGAAYAYGKRAHVGMVFFAHKLGEFPRTILVLLITILVAYFAGAVMVAGGSEYVKVAFVNQQESPTMGIPRAYLNLCIPLSGAFFLSYCVEFFVRDDDPGLVADHLHSLHLSRIA